VAGEAKGRRLQAPPGDDTRPTLDRVREAVFNALGSLDAVDGARVLDLFAGSGALGIEALSRGAAHATFVERDPEARRVIGANLATTGMADRAEVVARDAGAFLRRVGTAESRGRFDLVLLDPPYDTDDPSWEEILTSVAAAAPTGVVVIESARPVEVPHGWHVLREKGYGSTLVVIARPPITPSEPS
jgi:16S rRNA (guanine966-N2)-methyltransferase